ncbi:MAG: MraY family glycosyltransferase, partial [Thermodesulfobacteriota bacterium]|nr:MraY family glycosyltransferase [Thermodesulfobacteriota bacterium]
MLKRIRIMDVPNKRSSHDVAVPKSGGLAIAATFMIGVLVIYLLADRTMISEKFFMGFVSSAFLIAIVSFYDDLNDISVFIRLISQTIAASVVMIFGIVIYELKIPWVGQVQFGFFGYIVTFLWIVGLTNAYNFMDGINGIAGGTAVIACIFFSVICVKNGSNFTYIISYTIVAGSLGFLVFNFPKGRLFMGNVGSNFLGFTLATMAIIASLYDHSHTSMFVMPLLLFHFIYDTFFTFIRRFIRRENVFEAHRSHLYQLFNRLGYSQTTVSVFYFVVGIAQGFGAWWMADIIGNKRVLVFIPYLIFQIIYSII